MTADEMKEIKDFISEEFSALKTPWLNRHEAANYARVSTAIIDSLRHSKELPTHWIKGSPRFTKPEIDAVLKNGEAPVNGRGAQKKREAIARLLGEEVRTA